MAERYQIGEWEDPIVVTPLAELEVCKSLWFVQWAEDGPARYSREMKSAHRRKNGELDMRFAGSKFIASYERGEQENYGKIRLKPDAKP